MNSLSWPRISPSNILLYVAYKTAVIKKRLLSARSLYCDQSQSLLLDNIFRGRPFWTIHNIKCYPCAFFQRFESVGLNCGMMHKYILSAILLNKTKPF